MKTTQNTQHCRFQPGKRKKLLLTSLLLQNLKIILKIKINKLQLDPICRKEEKRV